MAKRLIQLVGPFSAGDTFQFTTNIDEYYCKIGMNRMYVEPIVNYCEYQKVIDPDIRINNKEYRINDRQILVFTDFKQISINIEILKDWPFESVIDLEFVKVDES